MRVMLRHMCDGECARMPTHDAMCLFVVERTHAYGMQMRQTHVDVWH